MSIPHRDNSPAPLPKRSERREAERRRINSLDDFNWDSLQEEDMDIPETEASDVIEGRVKRPSVGGNRMTVYGLGEGERAEESPAKKPISQQTIKFSDREDRNILINDLLKIMLDMGGSDLHLTAGVPPKVRVDGQIQNINGNFSPLTGNQIDNILVGIMTEAQRNRFEKDKELDFAYELPGESRFRVNVLSQRTHVGAVMRTIPNKILSLEELHLPRVINDFAGLPRGLVLVTGPTGSGKSTTLAGIIDKAKTTRRDHIMTIEDPIEFVHEHGNSIVNQREVGTDTHSFADALKHVLRQDPDIIMIGEMRDPETAGIALTAAETGHLVFATLHTQSAEDTINRIIDMFPEGAKEQVQAQLAASLQAIVCQTLLKRADGKGRIAATEILVNNHAIKNNIRKGKTEMIRNSMMTSASEGMQTLDSNLVELIRNGDITPDDGLQKAQYRDQMFKELGGNEGIERIKRENQLRSFRKNNEGGLR